MRNRFLLEADSLKSAVIFFCCPVATACLTAPKTVRICGDGLVVITTLYRSLRGPSWASEGGSPEWNVACFDAGQPNIID